MPTTAEQNYQSQLMQRMLAERGQNMQAGAANAAAQAAMYGADKNLEGTQDTNKANLASTSLQESGLNTRNASNNSSLESRARISNEPAMGQLAFDREKYGNSMDAFLGRVLNGGGIPPWPGGASGGTPGSSGGAPVAPTPAGAAATMKSTKSSGPAYDMNRFGTDVADIAAQVAAAKGTNPAMGPDDLTAANPWTPGASVRDVSGNLRTVAVPGLSNSSTPDRAAMVAKVKQAMFDEAAKPPPGIAAPSVAASPTSAGAIPEDARQLLIAAGKLKPSAAEEDARALRNANRDSLFKALNDPATPPAARVKAAQAMKEMDPSFDAARYAMTPAEQSAVTVAAADSAASLSKLSAGGVLPNLEADVAALEKKLAAPTFFNTSRDIAGVESALQALKDKALAIPGGADAWPQIKARLMPRLTAAAEHAGFMTSVRPDTPPMGREQAYRVKRIMDAL